MTAELPGADATRAGNAEREVVVGRLNDAFAEGRLDLAELDERVAQAYAAKTLGELRPLLADLPLTSESRPARPASATQPTTPPSRSPAPRSGRVAALPGWLRWQIYPWATVVGINVMIWLLVSIGSRSVAYPWPLWVAGPWGVVILAQALVARAERQHR